MRGNYFLINYQKGMMRKVNGKFKKRYQQRKVLKKKRTLYKHPSLFLANNLKESDAV